MSPKATYSPRSSGFQEPPSGNDGSVDAVAQVEILGKDGGTFFLPPMIRGRLAKSTVRSYGVALVFVAIALVPSLLLQRLFPYPLLYLFFAGVMASAWFCGTGPGLFTVFLSTVAVEYYFVSPSYSFAINTTDAAYLASFVVCALVASWVSSSKKKDQEALKDARGQLEVRVAERIAELQRSNCELQASFEQHEKSQQALKKTQAELAELSRFLTIGELTASIAHEVN
jgi:K+-sensing histidine kinase KdpD